MPRQRERMVCFRLNEEEHAEAMKFAEKQGASLSEFTRTALCRAMRGQMLEHTVEAHIDELERQLQVLFLELRAAYRAHAEQNQRIPG